MGQLGDFFSTADLSWWDFVFAALALVAGWILAALARRAVRSVGARLSGVGPNLISIATRLTGYFVWMLAIGVALAFLGANVQPLLVGVIIIGVVVVLALRGLAGNFGAGIVIQSRRPITLGDEVAVDGIVGVVHEFNARSVVIATADGRLFHVPNTTVMENSFSNNSTHGSRRSEIEVRVAVDRRRDEIASLVTDAVASAAGVHAKPHPVALFRELSPERHVFVVQFWHAPLTAVASESAAVAAASDALASAGVQASVQSVVMSPPLTPPAAL